MTLEALGTNYIRKAWTDHCGEKRKVPAHTETTLSMPCVPLSERRPQEANGRQLGHTSSLPMLRDPDPHTQAQGDNGDLLKLGS